MKKLLAYSLSLALGLVGFTAPAANSQTVTLTSIDQVGILPEGQFPGVDLNVNNTYIFGGSALGDNFLDVDFGGIEIVHADTSASSQRYTLRMWDGQCPGTVTGAARAQSYFGESVVAPCSEILTTVYEGEEIEHRTTLEFEGSFVRVSTEARFATPGATDNYFVIATQRLYGENPQGMSSGVSANGDWEIYDFTSNDDIFGLRSSTGHQNSFPEPNRLETLFTAPVTLDNTFKPLVEIEFFLGFDVDKTSLAPYADGQFGAQIPSTGEALPGDYLDYEVCETLQYGTPSNPIEFANEAELRELEVVNIATEIMCEENFDAYLKQTANIDASGSDWIPIVADFARLNLDGNGHSVTGLVINIPSGENTGLFGRVENAILRDVHVRAGDLIGDSDFGSLVGDTDGDFELWDSTVVVESMRSDSADIGGLVGVADDDVEVHNSNIFIGTMDSPDPSNTAGDIGGIAGDVNGFLVIHSSVIDVESVSGGTDVGGVAGLVDAAVSIRDSSFRIGDVNGEYSEIGGLLGQINSDIEILNSTVDVNSVSFDVYDDSGDDTNYVGVLFGRANSLATIKDTSITGSLKAPWETDGNYSRLAALGGLGNYFDSDDMLRLGVDVTGSFLDLKVISQDTITESTLPEYDASAIGSFRSNISVQSSTIIFETDARIASTFSQHDEGNFERLRVDNSSIDFTHKYFDPSEGVGRSLGITEDNVDGEQISNSALKYSPQIQELAGSGPFPLDLIADFSVDLENVTYLAEGLHSDVTVPTNNQLVGQDRAEFLTAGNHPAYSLWTSETALKPCSGIDVMVASRAVADCSPNDSLGNSQTVRVNFGREANHEIFANIAYPVTASEALPLGLILDPLTGVISGKLNSDAELDSVDVTFVHPTGEHTVTLNFTTQAGGGFSAPVPLQGPIVTSVTTSGNTLTVSGERLELVTSLSLLGQTPTIQSQSATQIIALVADAPTGEAELEINFSQGSISYMTEFDIGEVSEAASTTGFWTTQISPSEIKLYAKNIVGAGKVQFFHNGNEVAWVNAEDDSDTKLRVISEGPMTGANYLVRTRELVAGKNIFEIYVDGQRQVRRAASLN